MTNIYLCRAFVWLGHSQLSLPGWQGLPSGHWVRSLSTDRRNHRQLGLHRKFASLFWVCHPPLLGVFSDLPFASELWPGQSGKRKTGQQRQTSCRKILWKHQGTGKSIDSERHMTAPEIRLVLTVGFDPRGYFLGGLNLFRLSDEKLFGFFICIITCYSIAKISMCPLLLLCSVEMVLFLYLLYE